MKKISSSPKYMLIGSMLCMLVFSAPFHASAANVPAPKEKLELTAEVQQALDEILEATAQDRHPKQESLDTVAAFAVFDGMGTGSRLLPEREQGMGVFYHTPMPFTLKELIEYSLNPDVPSAALYPNTIRRTSWEEGSPVKNDWKQFAESPLPPAQTLFTGGRESEEITPDETSGAYYTYWLKRQIALTPVKTNKGEATALFMISVQDGESEIGLKGAVLGSDADWNYVYTGVQGSTLPMVGWAKTHVYDSATISVWVEHQPGDLHLYTFKWLKAGWSGMNVVKPEHINAGIARYVNGFKQTMGSGRPTPEAIAQRFAELSAMDEAQLAQALKPYSLSLEKQASGSKATGGDFEKVLANGTYGESLNRDERLAELIKLYMKEKLGMTAPGA